jgi:uncharacterized protein (DUF433 family)
MNIDAVLSRISSDPEILNGKPCVKGTRIPVWLVIGMLGDGMTETEVLDSYPSLTEDDIYACLKFASLKMDYERMLL